MFTTRGVTTVAPSGYDPARLSVLNRVSLCANIRYQGTSSVAGVIKPGYGVNVEPGNVSTSNEGHN